MMASNSAEDPKPGGSDKKFDEFYVEVKAIESRDSVLTSVQQIDRLLRPGATYFNLNPFEVLQVDHELPQTDIKKRYRQMSILVHPDKNQDDADRAQIAFEAVNNAYKTLENEEGYKRCQEVIEEAKSRTEEVMQKKRKQLKKEGKPVVIPEDESATYSHTLYVQTAKLFADLERLRREREMKDMHDRKKAAVEEEDEKVRKKEQAEWNKNFEESRDGRVDSWRNFSGKSSKSGKKKKEKKAPYLGGFKPPKLKPESR